MSYTPTVWRTGDKVTAPLMNKLEQGVANAKGGSEMLVVTGTVDGSNKVVLDKTALEIYEACLNGTFWGYVVPPTHTPTINFYYVVQVAVFAKNEDEGAYRFVFYSAHGNESFVFTATGDDEIPTMASDSSSDSGGGEVSH